ncbi:MAG: HAD-superfamily hydrolase, subfamily variant 1 [Proteobacteria bacterium]|nr:HAD-superfamily hydrolase, subfamily variant 1 [Pseudomonadota bacterium]
MTTRNDGAVFFDLDETLVDRRASVMRFAQRLWQEGEVHAESESTFLNTFIALDDNGRSPGPARFEALCAQHLPHTNPHALFERFRREAWVETTLLPDAVSVLEAVAARGYRVGIVSNGSSASQRAKIRNTALRPWDEVAVISGELGCKKPDPAIYLHALSMLDVAPENCWFVGDDAFNDVLGPATLGLRPIWVERHVGWPQQHAHAYVARVTQLTEVLDVLP